MYTTLYIPVGLWGLILITLLIVAAHAGLFAFENLFKNKNIQHNNNEAAGIVFGALALIYSLLIAFVIVAVWENYDDLNLTIEKEADDLNSVLVHSAILHDSLRQPIIVSIKSYCQEVINKEWDMTDNQELNTGSAIPALRLLLFRIEPSNKLQENVLTVIDNKLSEITNLHRQRLSHTRSNVPHLVWMVLIVGSIMVIIFSYFLHMESKHLKIVFLSFLWCLMGMCLFLVFMLDHPFVGSTQVSKAPYEEIIKNLTTSHSF